MEEKLDLTVTVARVLLARLAQSKALTEMAEDQLEKILNERVVANGIRTSVYNLSVKLTDLEELYLKAMRQVNETYGTSLSLDKLEEEVRDA